MITMDELIKNKLFSALDKGLKDFKNFKKKDLVEINNLFEELLKNPGPKDNSK